MKKILAMMLTAAMMLSMGTAAMAASYDVNENEITSQPNSEGQYVDTVTVKITKTYKNPNSAVSPAETFNFTSKKYSVTDQAVGVTLDNMPDLVSVESVSFNEGDAGKVIISNGSVQYLCNREVVVTLPTYRGVGIYTYIIKEVAGNTAGVEYFDGEIKLVVTVVQGEDGQFRIAGVHTEQSEEEAKSDLFANEYEAGKLAISKTVTGNLGDQTKNFTVNVTFKVPDDEVVMSRITYTDDGIEKEIVHESYYSDGEQPSGETSVSWKGIGEISVPITLKHDETVTFENIPYGVTYTVEEEDYTNEGYDPEYYTINGDIVYDTDGEGKVTEVKSGAANGWIGEANETVNITNNKENPVDTGISVDSIPYIAMLGVVAIGGTGFVVSKKRRSED